MARVYQPTRSYVETGSYAARGSNLAERIVYFIGSAIISLLVLRFILSLLGANPGNLIANFIYGYSQPFVAPFFGLFNYSPQVGIVRLEFETLVAIAFYAVAMAIIGNLVGLGRRRADY